MAFSTFSEVVPSLGGYALTCNAQMPKSLGYSRRMGKPTPKVILAENLTKLMIHRGFVKPDGTPNQNRLFLAFKERNIQADQTTVGRILNQTSSVTLDKLEGIAQFFGLELWQITMPGLDPDNLPVQPLSFAEREAVRKLVALQSINVDGFQYPSSNAPPPQLANSKSH